MNYGFGGPKRGLRVLFAQTDQNSSEALLGGLPVDDVPDVLKVLGLAVLVLEAERSWLDVS